MSPQLSSLLFLVVGISMAITPWLAAGGQLIASRFELHDVRSLLPVESEVGILMILVDNFRSISIMVPLDFSVILKLTHSLVQEIITSLPDV